MNFYVTKYALTDGIWEVPADNVKISDDQRYMYVYTDARKVSRGIQVKELDYHFTLPAAEARVRELVEKKLKSLDKARAKMASYKPKVVRKLIESQQVAAKPATLICQDCGSTGRCAKELIGVIHAKGRLDRTKAVYLAHELKNLHGSFDE